MPTLKLGLIRVSAAVVVLSLFAGCSAEARKARRLEKAATFFKQGNYDAARIEYLNVLQADPKNAVALEQVGLIWLEHGANVTALPFLVRARELSPKDHELRIKLGEAFLAVGKVELARKEARAVLDAVPGHGDALVLLVQAIRSAEDFKEAQRESGKVSVRNEVSQHLAAAGLAQRSGDGAAAKTAALRAIAADPKSHKAHLAMGALHQVNNDLASAEKEYKLASELAPLRSSSRLKYAEFKAQTGAVDEATTLLQEIAKKAPDYIPTWTSLAQIAIAQKKYDEALGHVQQVVKRDPASYDAALIRAQIHLTKGEVDSAIEELLKVGKAYGGLPADKYQLARAYLLKKDIPKAQEALKMTIVANPDHEEAILQFSQISLRTGQAESVVPLLVELLRQRPNLVRAQVLLIDAMRVLKRPDDAAKLINEQIRVYPKSAQPHYLLGMLLREQNKPAEARASFEKSLELAPESVPVMAQLIDLDIREKKFDAALARAKGIVAKHPQALDAHMLEARVLAANSKWREAEAILLKNLERDANYGGSYELLSYGYLSKSLPEPPFAKFDAMLAADPANSRMALMLASIHHTRKDYAKARDVYEKSIAARPDAVLLNNLSYLYAEHLNQLDRGRDLARQARKLEPESPIIADTLGWILAKRQEYPEALELLKESAAKMPNNAEIQYHLGTVHQALNQPDEARAAYEKAAKIGTDFPGKDDLARRLAAVGGAAKTN